VEGTVAIDPKDPTRIFAASNNETAGLFTAYSHDDGATWTSPAPIAFGLDDLPPALSDPKAAFDTYGNLFLTYIDRDLAVVVALSTDGGKTFHELTTFAPNATDQPSIATGPGFF